MPAQASAVLPRPVSLLGVLVMAAAGAAMTVFPPSPDLFTARPAPPTPPVTATTSSLPPATNRPATSPPVSAPVTGPPTTVPPATIPPTTVEPTTVEPVAEEPAFLLSPSSGPDQTQVVARGTGCAGSGAGVSLEMVDPTGRHYTSDGGASLPDGSWWVEFVFVAEAPAASVGGDYQVRATCRVEDGAVFEYPPQTFTLLGQ